MTDGIRVPALQGYRLALAVAAKGLDARSFGLVSVSADEPPEPCDRIPRSELAAALIAAAEEGGMPDLALCLAQTATPAAIDLTGGILFASASLREGLGETFRHWPLLGSTRFHHFEPTASGARLRFEVPAGMTLDRAWAICAEWTFAELVLGLRVVSRRPATPARVRLTHTSAWSAPGLAEVLGCDVELDAEVSALDLRADDVDAPLPGHNPVLLAYFRGKVEAMVAELDDTRPVADRVRAVLSRDLAGAELRTVARRLASSARALQRSLGAEGTGFSRLLDEERKRRSLELLDQGVAIGAVAERVGFSQARAFHRAFRRWTATTPQRWLDDPTRRR